MSVEQSVAASELRHAFRYGPTSEAAALFLHGLDSGLDWETATQAVAQGTAEHFGAAADGQRAESAPGRELGPRGGSRGALRTVGRVLLGTASGGVLGATLGMLLFAAAAALLDATEAIVAPLAALAPWADPIYTRAALHSVADIHIGGLAVAGGGGLIGLVLEPGSSVLGRLFAAGVANCGVLVVALLLIRHGVFRRSPGWIAASVGAQLEVALNVLGSPPSMNDLETIGLSFAVNACLPWLAGRRLVVSDLVSSVPASILVAALVALALIIAYMGAAAVVVGGLVIRRKLSSGHRARGRSAARSAGKRRRAVLATLAITSALVAFSALVAACQIAPAPTLPASPAVVQHVAGPGEQAGSGLGSARAADTSLPLSVSSVRIVPGDRWYTEPALPSRVEVVATGDHFEYRVNGEPEVIKGMGLNTQYAAQLSPADRAARLDSDMAALKALGVNTVLGWDPAEFDEVLLDAAQRHAIGVVLPFDLHPDADYTDPAVRAELTNQVLAWVQRYRYHPALRMWAPGNEVLHKIVHPAWVGPQDPHQAAEAHAFSDWLVDTADLIHATDPDHPVTYRDAEDAFVGWVARAFERHPAGPRPWFVWGTNCYQDYLSSIVDAWPDQGLGIALWVSEFAPGGMPVPDRPEGLRQMWGYVRRHPGWVLGGGVYAWTRNGPEEIDRSLGLTDDGAPADGHSLDAIAGLFAETGAEAGD